jgi:hypothetical protein
MGKEAKQKKRNAMEAGPELAEHEQNRMGTKCVGGLMQRQERWNASVDAVKGEYCSARSVV